MIRRRPLIVAATVAIALAGCSTGHHKAKPSPSASPSTAPPTKAAGPNVPPGGWLTGLRGPTCPVVIIKVDNAPDARPLQVGLENAQVVYQEIVEGGVTRFLGVYAGKSTSDVGPVRSGRDTDIEILAPYGRVIYGFAGANRGVLNDLSHANLSLVPIQYRDGSFVQRGARLLPGGGIEEYNFFTSTARLIPFGTGHIACVKDVGFRFGATLAGGRPLPGRVVARFTPDSLDGLRWDPTHHGWRIDQNGTPVQMADGRGVRPQNILIQLVRVHPGRYVDVVGENSPDSTLIGSGGAILLRDGRMYLGYWSRPHLSDLTTWKLQNGKPMLLAPGRTWVLLAPTGTRLVNG